MGYIFMAAIMTIGLAGIMGIFKWIGLDEHLNKN
jgi:hypothetical protein